MIQKHVSIQWLTARLGRVMQSLVFQMATLCGLLVLSIFSINAPLVTAQTSSDTNDFIVTEFDAEYTLDNKDPQGTMVVTEQISVDFHAMNHGILRAIPKSYKDHDVALEISSVTSATGAPTEYTTYESEGNEVLKIGDPDRTVTGKQQYTIAYTVNNVITFYDDHDELYWDINGDQWKQPFTKVTATLRVRTGTVQDQRCFAGGYGLNDAVCAVSSSDNVVTATADNLVSGQTLSLVASLNKGTYRAPTFQDWLQDHILNVVGIVAAPLLIGGWAFRRWHRDGKDLAGRGVIIPEYDVPDKLSPAEVGVIYNNSLKTQAVSATIINLAIRKILRIEELEEDGFLRKKKKYQLVLLQTDWTALKTHENQILQAIFPSPQVNDAVEIKKIKSFYETFTSLQSSLPDTLTTAGYYPANPIRAGKGMIAVGVAMIFGAWFFMSALSIGIAISGALLILFGILMPKRTAEGVITREHIEGLKLYMETAEKDRMAMLQSPNAPYAKPTAGPVKTVELFEKLLPFAIVLGVEKEWAKEFKDIYTQPPEWYAGNWAAFNTGVFAHSLTSSMGAMNTSFAPPSSSGSSGMSGGGGFSGGGGGGGGGGGW